MADLQALPAVALVDLRPGPTTPQPSYNGGPIQFAPGRRGDTGPAASVAVGDVSLGEEVSVHNSGTSSAAVLDFVIPRGAPGDQGDPGPANLVIGPDAPTPAAGASVLWLDTTGGNVTLNLVTGD